MSRIIVYLDRDLNIFQASRRAAGWPGQGAPDPKSQIEMDSVRSEGNNDGCGADFRVSWCVSREIRHGHINLGKVGGGGGGESQCGCDLCVDLSADSAGPGQPMQTHMASLIVSAESLYSLFTRSLNDSSCWNYCSRGKGTRYSHLLHTFVLGCRTHLFRCSVPTEFTQANVMSGSEWITEISECNLPPAETRQGTRQGAMWGKSWETQS